MFKYMSENAAQLQVLIENFSGQFREVRAGLMRAHRISAEDPEMALARIRKVLEYVIREVYERRVKEPAGTRPLENLIQRLQKDAHLPERVIAYASAVRILGNAGVHGFGADLTTADVYHALSLLTPVLDWYCKKERPDALVREGGEYFEVMKTDDMAYQQCMIRDMAYQQCMIRRVDDDGRPQYLRQVESPPPEIEAYAVSSASSNGSARTKRWKLWG
jgi:hypothetical protein